MPDSLPPDLADRVDKMIVRVLHSSELIVARLGLMFIQLVPFDGGVLLGEAHKVGICAGRQRESDESQGKQLNAEFRHGRRPYPLLMRSPASLAWDAAGAYSPVGVRPADELGNSSPCEKLYDDT
jgi:hypothetical protein